MKYLLIIFLISYEILASSLNIEFGKTKTNYNRFSVPNNSIDNLEMPQGDSDSSYRLTGYFDLANKNQLYLLIAPLEVNYKFLSTSSFKFNKTNFSSNTETEASYKFNSYRLGYLWTWSNSNFRYWIGFVGKIRDAKIEIKQNTLTDSYDNLGFVPLASFGFEWMVINNLAIFSHTDGLAASQGSAYDSSFEFKYYIGNFATSLGFRILGGGADNDSVYTFAQFDTIYLKLNWNF